MKLQILKSIRLTLSIIIALYMAMLFGFKEPGWAVTSVLVVSLGLMGEVKRKWLQRISGHFIGCFLGFIFIWNFSANQYFMLFGVPFSLAFLGYLSYENFLVKDLLKWIGVGFVIVISATIDRPYSTFNVAVDRFFCVTIGSTITYIVFSLIPLGIYSNIEKHYYDSLNIFSTIIGQKNISNRNFYDLFIKISDLISYISSNSDKFNFNKTQSLNYLNKLYALEKIALSYFSFISKYGDKTSFQNWLTHSISRKKYRKENLYFSDRFHSSEINKIIHYLNNDQYNLALKLQKQEKNFGLESPLINAVVIFLGCFFSIYLWKNGLPNGASVLVLCFVILLNSQNNERTMPFLYIKGFILGAIISFPLLVLVFPYVRSSDSFWFFLILLYLPLSILFYGNYLNRGANFTLFAAVAILNINSNNYHYNSLVHYTDFIISLLATTLITTFLLSVFNIKNPRKKFDFRFEKCRKILVQNYLQRKVINTHDKIELERIVTLTLNTYLKQDEETIRIMDNRIKSLLMLLYRIEE